MKTTYAIVKSSRAFSGHSYAGPSCQAAGVQPGKIYGSLRSARRVARRLNAVNAIGFRAVEIGA